MIEFILTNRNMRFLKATALFLLLNAGPFLPLSGAGTGETFGQDASGRPSEAIRLVKAVICENIKDFAPENPGVVFPVSIGRVNCFTSFESVDEDTFIFHRWYHRDRLITTFRLELRSPKWATRSAIQLRQTDKGPWRVEIVDNSDRIIGLLRFSITD